MHPRFAKSEQTWSGNDYTKRMHGKRGTVRLMRLRCDSMDSSSGIEGRSHSPRLLRVVVVNLREQESA